MTPEKLAEIRALFNAVLHDSSTGTTHGLELLAYCDRLLAVVAAADAWLAADMLVDSEIDRELAEHDYIKDIDIYNRNEASREAFRAARAKLEEP